MYTCNTVSRHNTDAGRIANASSSTGNNNSKRNNNSNDNANASDSTRATTNSNSMAANREEGEPNQLVRPFKGR